MLCVIFVLLLCFICRLVFIFDIAGLLLNPLYVLRGLFARSVAGTLGDRFGLRRRERRG